MYPDAPYWGTHLREAAATQQSMSNQPRQSVHGTGGAKPSPSIRPGPYPMVGPSDADDHSSSSDSSTSSAASVDTVRPSSHEGEAPVSHWTHYFEQELFLGRKTDTQTENYHVYLSPPSNPKKDPLFICHHGAGASGLSFAVFAREVRRRLPDAGILSLEACGHGSTVTDNSTGEEIIDFCLATLTANALAMISLTAARMGWGTVPPSVLVGHSLGGAIVATIASEHFRALGTSFIGYCVIDVVEGSAIEALSHMRMYLSSRPSSFNTSEEAIQWHIRNRAIRDPQSARASVPGLLMPSPVALSTRLVWRTDLLSTEPWWEQWFKGMSQKFLTGRGAKMLILAGTDRLDRELMIGQMQGKFQLVVIPEAGHFVQEDVPEKTAGLLVEFFKRNDRSNLVLPPKVSDLIAQGKKV